MPTMQEYLEEMARRQALGWTPGVPSRFTAPVATSWNLPTTARTTMRQAVPKANLGDIAAASADPVRKQGVGRPRLTPEEIQRTASRQGMGTVGKTVRAIAPFAKVAGPIGLAYDVLRSEPAVASELASGAIPGDFRVTQAYPSMDNVYTDPTAMAYAGVTPPGEEFGSSYAGPNTMGLTEVAPSMDVDYSQALADIGVEPSIDVQTQVDTFAGMAEVPSAGSDFFGGGVDAPFDFVDTSPTQAQLDDITRHSGLTFGVPVYTGDWTDIATHIPSQNIREIIRDRHDNISDFLDDETTTDKLQDLVNNQIAIDMLAQSGPVDFDSPAAHALDREFKDNPNVVVNKDSLNAMVGLAKKDYYKDEAQVQEAINEIKSGVDTFKDVTTPAGPTPAEIAAANAAANALAAANARAKTAAQNRAKKSAQKALAAQKAAAARRAKIARQALKDSQAAAARAQAASAAQAKSAQKAAKAVLARMSSDRNAPSQAEINAAIEVMSQVDTFGGGSIGFDGGGFDPQGGETGSSGMGAWT